MMTCALSQWANNLRLGLIGNPENRRIKDFQSAVENLGLPAPVCLSYEDLLRDPESLNRLEADVLRIDSPGENEAVASALIALGGGPPNARLAFGEIGFLREFHRGFCAVLEQINAREKACMNRPEEIAVMFDKCRSHQRFVENGVARPSAEQAPADFKSFWKKTRAQKSGRLFLKPLHGSSASGVCAIRWNDTHQQLIAPIWIESNGDRVILVNSLEVRTYTSLADLELILGILLPQGMICEEWIPKLSLPGGSIDLRVLVIAGEARHWVVRQSHHPMTNLHLGNHRGDKVLLLEEIGSHMLEGAFRLAEKAAACFPESFYAGVDILIDSRHRAFVGEINAFGDLLPGITDRDESVYSAIARAFYRQVCVV